MGLRVLLVVSLLMPMGKVAYAAPTERLIKERLDYHLMTVQETAHSRRLTRSVSSIVMGAVFGVTALVSSDSNNATFRSSGPWIFGISGGVLLLSGLTGLFIRSSYETLPEKYLLMPEATDSELRAKRSAGELYLTSMARDAKAQRWTSSAISLAVGATSLIFYAADSARVSDFFLIEGIALAGIGLIGLVIRSPAEQEADSYLDWKQEKGVVTSFRFDVVPIRNGAALFADVRF